MYLRMDSEPSTSSAIATSDENIIRNATILRNMEGRLVKLEEQYGILVDLKEEEDDMVSYLKIRRNEYEHQSEQHYWDRQVEYTIGIIKVRRTELEAKIERKMEKIKLSRTAIEVYAKLLEAENKENMEPEMA